MGPPDNDTGTAALLEAQMRLARYAAGLTGDRESAQDLVQEAVAKYYVALGKGTVVNSPEAYLRRIVSSEFLNGRRRARLWASSLHRVAGPAAVDDSIASEVATREDARRALAALPARQRAALLLRYYEDLSYVEIAETLSCAETTARSLVRRGLKKLRVEEQGAE